ncbi:MAG: hypothetical protein AB8E87_06630, partial [Prochlorococcus sp.]
MNEQLLEVCPVLNRGADHKPAGPLLRKRCLADLAADGMQPQVGLMFSAAVNGAETELVEVSLCSASL